jgi:4-amino-4-deoxy-L-arabinose transferase-like glycosyltransferase
MLVATQEKTFNRAYSARRLKLLLCSIAIMLGAIQAWSGRHEMNPDGIAYLDMADAYLRGDWSTALNAQWSPLYSWLMAAALLVVKPSPAWEFPAAHLMNFAIYLFALGCFDFLLRQWSRRREWQGDSFDGAQASLPEWAWVALVYALFMWSSLQLITVSGIHPDMLVSAFVYLAMGLLLRAGAGHTGLCAAGLGAALGFGYLAKAPMFLLAFVFIAASLFAAGSARKALPRAAVALILFLMIAGPFIFAISQAKGRPTFGDSGKLNYAWYVNGVTRFIHWQGAEHAYGTPAHTTRKIFDSPAAYEFATPIESTYPPWYDPSYWYEGVEPRFNLAGQIKVLWSSADVWWHLFFNMQRGLIVLLFILLCLTGRSNLRLRELAAQGYLFAPSLAAFGMFSLVNLETRYIAPFMLIFWMGLLSLVRLPDTREMRRLMRFVTVAMLAVLTITTAPSIIKDAIKSLAPASRAHPEVAAELSRMGVRPGDKVAMVGDSFRAYWARLARARIVAEIPSRGPYGEITAGDEDKFWRADDAIKSQVFEALAKAGAVMVVTDNVPPLVAAQGWQKLGNTRYYAHPLTAR